MAILEDGTGTGNTQKVSANNRAYTYSLANTAQEAAVDKQEAYHAQSGILTLTAATESGLFYFKNTSDIDFRIRDIVGGFGLSTGGATGDVALIRLVRNPTAGTLISDATEATVRCNRHFGSANKIQDTSLVYEGDEAKTITDGVTHFYKYIPEGSSFTQLVDEVIPRGKALAIMVTPPASNTSMTSYVGIIGHYEDPND
jgi:hypothetical protein